MKKFGKRRAGVTLLFVALLGILLAGTALSAEFGDGDVYRLPADEVLNDDLYVSANEIYIDGVIDGDLYAIGGYIEMNGEVTGDVVMAGGGLVISGLVGDDVRVAGAGIDILGTIQDDLFVAGGGAGPGGFAFPFQFGGRSIQQGVSVDRAAEIGGDAYLIGGAGTIEGAIGGDLVAGMGRLVISAQVGGDAELSAEELRIEEGAGIAGTLTYSTPDRLAEAGEVAPDVVYEEAQREEEATNIVADLFRWLLRTLLILLGFALLGWLLLRFAPNLLADPAAAIDAEPVETGLYGLVGALLFVFIPILSTILVILMALFWGLFPAIVMFLFLFGSLALLWFFSPLVTGLWLGRRIVSQTGSTTSLLVALLVGVLILVILGRVPFLGWLIYLLSFIFALGGLIRAGRPQRTDPGEPVAVAVSG